jgi:hypothetical protein
MMAKETCENVGILSRNKKKVGRILRVPTGVYRVAQRNGKI